MLKTIIKTAYSDYELWEKVNDYIMDSKDNIIDIKYSTCFAGNNIHYSAMILYNDRIEDIINKYKDGA